MVAVSQGRAEVAEEKRRVRGARRRRGGQRQGSGLGQECRRRVLALGEAWKECGRPAAEVEQRKSQPLGVPGPARVLNGLLRSSRLSVSLSSGGDDDARNEIALTPRIMSIVASLCCNSHPSVLPVILSIGDPPPSFLQSYAALHHQELLRVEHADWPALHMHRIRLRPQHLLPESLH